MSLVFLTVLAGLGQGVFIILVALDALLPSGSLPQPFVYSAAILSIALPMAGMFAGFFHLGNPQRGWKAIKMVKSSWLSREVLFLPAFIGLDALYTALYFQGAPGAYRLAAGFAGIFCALGLYVSSAMLYAEIRFIKEWANAYTVVNFILLGLASGASAIRVVWHFEGAAGGVGDGLSLLAVVLLALALAMKTLAYRHNAGIYQSLAVKDAIGVSNPDARLMNSGAAYRHFNTIEYFFPISPEKNLICQTVTLTIAFIIPIVSTLSAESTGLELKGLLLVLSALSTTIGLLIERRLFFIQGNHIQNLYYGNYRFNEVKNPLLRKSA